MACYKKLFIITAFIFLLICLFNTNVKANFEFDYNGVSYSIPDLPENDANFNKNAFVICKNRLFGGHYILASFPQFQKNNDIGMISSDRDFGYLNSNYQEVSRY